MRGLSTRQSRSRTCGGTNCRRRIPPAYCVHLSAVVAARSRGRVGFGDSSSGGGMTVRLVSDASNVLAFPGETRARPSVELIMELAPSRSLVDTLLAER